MHIARIHLSLCVAAVLLSATRCIAQCSFTVLTVEIAGSPSEVPVPEQREGGSYRHECSWARQGYDGFIEVKCLGQRLTAETNRCKPVGCVTGQLASGGIIKEDGQTLNVVVELTEPLPHRSEKLLPCRIVESLGAYNGRVRLTCTLGELMTDLSNCHQAGLPERRMWRMRNVDFLPGAWKVFEVSLYTSIDCTGNKLHGIPIASSQDFLTGEISSHAFDGDFSTSWAASCERGCLPGTAWIGLVLPASKDIQTVRCLRLLQSQVPCCGSRNVGLDVWDGYEWQSMQVWDTKQARLSAVYGFELTVPITCSDGIPTGTDIVHDCVGRPVVGRQDGDTCKVSCREGFYGEPSSLSCNSDGIFVGALPACYELQAIGRIASFASIGAAVLLLAWQYKFWCMFRKLQLTHEIDMIPQALMGRWLEKEGATVWEAMLNEKKREENRSAFDFEDDNKNDDGVKQDAADKRNPKAFLNKKKLQQEAKAKADKEEADLNDDPKAKVYLDGLWSPCEDPDICWACCCCPLCRAADTWHTIGMPPSLSYWKVFLMYVLCPFMWPCLNFYGRLRVRKTFGIPLAPHRDCIIHCCCCCCCTPCAAIQEARLVDAPMRWYQAKRKIQEKKAIGMA